MGTPFEWTDERIALLKRMWGESYSGSQIARTLGISRNAVAGKVFRLGLSEKRPPVHRPRPVPVKSETIDFGPGKPFLEVLMSNGCKFAVTPHDATSHLFCGGERFPGEPYCGAHCRRAFNYEATRKSNRRVAA